MRHILVVIASLVLFYFCIGFVANITQLANASDRIYMGLGQYVFWMLTSIFALFVVSPIVMYLKMPKALVPPDESEGQKHEEYMLKLRFALQNNNRLKGVAIENNEDVISALKMLSKEADNVIRQTASIVFVGTAVMQNGRIDGLITLITQAKLVWQIASIYNQRPSPRQMIYLYSNVGAAALLAQSLDDIDFAEIVAPIVVSIIPLLKGAVPGLQGISHLLVNSLSSGATNTLITLRVGFVAKQYCEALSTPSRQLVRRNATLSALSIVGEIAKENSIRIVKQVWDTVSGMGSDAIDATVKKLSDAANKVAESTAAATRKLVDAMNSSAEGLKDVAEKASVKVKESTAEATMQLVNVIDSETEGIQHAVENASVKIKESTADATRKLGDAISVTTEGIIHLSERAGESLKINVEKTTKTFSDVYENVMGKLTSNNKSPER